jgi:putative transposase
MSRLPRPDLPGVAQHVVQRGNDRLPCFYDDEDRWRYLAALRHVATRYACSIHVYVLMTNHVHLLVTPRTADSVPRTMQTLGRRYVRYVNATYGRTRTLWEGRYRAAPIDSEAYFLACCRYIELNPVRARMVASSAANAAAKRSWSTAWWRTWLLKSQYGHFDRQNGQCT